MKKIIFLLLTLGLSFNIFGGASSWISRLKD
jgi:hypothetical protein